MLGSNPRGGRKEKGNLYSFGCNSDGQLGLGNESSKSFYSQPVQIESVYHKDWLIIAAGSSQSAALTSEFAT